MFYQNSPVSVIPPLLHIQIVFVSLQCYIIC